MDHFALPDDALAVAKRQGRLHRNFQGYSTQPDCDLIGLGVSAIGRMGGTYSQNAKSMDEYVGLLDHGQLPIVKGVALSRDDLIRRAWIMAIMCQGQVQYDAFNEAWLIDVQKYFASEFSQLELFQTHGLVVLTEGGLQVTPMGWFFVRGVAMVFDKYLQANLNRTRFSKII
jgi:oxygen-independent coproporphyrinogen-3 oxidase